MSFLSSLFFLIGRVKPTPIYLTGLMGVPSIEARKNIVAMLNKLIEQLGARSIHLVTFENTASRAVIEETAKNNGTAAVTDISNIQDIINDEDFRYKAKIDGDLEVRGLLNPNEVDKEAFILNFAGDEIEGDALMKNLRCYTAHLYHGTFEFQLENLIVENHEGRAIIPNILYPDKGEYKVYDRRSKSDDTPVSAVRPRF